MKLNGFVDRSGLARYCYLFCGSSSQLQTIKGGRIQWSERSWDEVGKIAAGFARRKAAPGRRSLTIRTCKASRRCAPAKESSSAESAAETVPRFKERSRTPSNGLASWPFYPTSANSDHCFCRHARAPGLAARGFDFARHSRLFFAPRFQGQSPFWDRRLAGRIRQGRAE